MSNEEERISSTPAPITPASWDEFRNSGLLWFVNRTLHLFGWTIVYTARENADGEMEILNVYPARTSFRGFDAESEDKGFHNLTNHINEEMPWLVKETRLSEY